MKTIYFNIIFISLLIFGSAFAQKSGSSFYSGGHDSLLFDGQNNTYTPHKNADGCDIFVTFISGTSRAMKKVFIMDETCGEYDTTTKFVFGPLRVADRIKEGENIEVGPGSVMEFELKIGNESLKIRSADKSTLQVAKSVCEQFKKDLSFDPKLGIASVLTLLGGKVHISDEGFLGTYNKGVETFKSVMNWSHTKFTVETKVEGSDTLDILKVYEGSVQVSLKKYDSRSMDTQGEAIEKIYKDFQAGKITQEEMIEKMKPYTEGVSKEVSEMKLSETVNAGYQLTVGKKLGTPEPIGADDNRWFDDANFK